MDRRGREPAAGVPRLHWDGPAATDQPPGDRPPLVVLAHGAGAGLDSAFLVAVTERLVTRGLRVVRFEFPFMAQRRTGGPRRPPDRESVLLETWDRVLQQLARAGESQLVVGGKSLGGRMASLAVARHPLHPDSPWPRSLVRGLVCLAYPFHPAGKPDRLRVDHLRQLACPTLIIQGDRDPLGTQAEVSGYGLPSTIRLVWLPDGDHDFRPRRASGYTLAANLDAAATAVQRFVCRTISD